MKVLVVPNDLGSGSQIAALRLAEATRDRGHEVIVFSVDGPLAARCRANGIRLVVAPKARTRPALGLARRLRRVCRAEGVDLVHAYETVAIAEAFVGAHLLDGLPMVGTVHGTQVPLRSIPPRIPLVVGGRPALARRLAGLRPGPVVAVAPPVDLPPAGSRAQGEHFRADLGLDPDAPVLVVVSRLVAVEKVPGIEAVITATGLLARDRPLHLVVVGDGPMKPAFEDVGRSATGQLGRPVLTFTGEIADPGPAFAAADIVLGRGTSVLGGMAHGKPAIVLGAHGACGVVDEGSIDHYLEHAFLEPPGPPRRLVDLLAGLLDDPARRHELGALGRHVVAQSRSADEAAQALEAVYRAALRSVSPRREALLQGVVLVTRLVPRRLRRVIRPRAWFRKLRWRGGGPRSAGKLG
jgi:glycosyltransferase involved in cell wall biosynthesis